MGSTEFCGGGSGGYVSVSAVAVERWGYPAVAFLFVLVVVDNSLRGQVADETPVSQSVAEGRLTESRPVLDKTFTGCYYT